MVNYDMQLLSRIAVIFALAITVLTPAAQAATPSQRYVCDTDRYACLSVDQSRVAAGSPATFNGILSKRAAQNLRNWTLGANDICLTRYATTPSAEGWPSKTLNQACTTVKRDRRFTLTATLDKRGTYFYGIEMGPCTGSAGLCGNGDGFLVGVGGNRKVTLTTY